MVVRGYIVYPMLCRIYTIHVDVPTSKGEPYTFQGFIDYYGEEEAREKWEVAEVAVE